MHKTEKLLQVHIFYSDKVKKFEGDFFINLVKYLLEKYFL